MASTPLGPVSGSVTRMNQLPSMPAVARILSRFDRQQLSGFIAVAIDLADAMDGDPEAEELPLEDAFVSHNAAFADEDSDGKDTSWPEWHTRGRFKAAASELRDTSIHEDDEDNGDRLDGSGAEDDPDYRRIAAHLSDGPGCPISDQGGCEHDGREPDTDDEREQMLDDVPMLPVVSADHNIFSDARTALGLSNLQCSYRTNGGRVISTDSGAVHQISGGTERPGSPV